MTMITEEKLSLTRMSQNFKEDGITRNMVLEYLVNMFGYVKDAKEITELGFRNGVSYVTSEEEPSVKWPVYGPEVQELLAKHIEEIKALKPADVPKIRNKRLELGQPEKVPEDEMPDLVEVTSFPSKSYVVYDFETTGLKASQDARPI